MRVTSNMLANSLKYWIARQGERLSEVETVSSSGKKIDKPSDSPVSTEQILNYRTTISQLGQYQSNISLAQTRIELGNNVLDAAYSLLQEAQSIVVDQSAGDLDTREEMKNSLAAIYDQIVDLADTMSGGQYIYSGNQPYTKAFADETIVSGGVAQDIVFDLAADADSVEIEIKDSSGNVVRTMSVSGGVEGTNTMAWDGLDDSGVQVADGTYQYTITAADTSADPVASYATYRGGAGGQEMIVSQNSVISIDNNGGKIFSSTLKAISEAVAALGADPYDSSNLSGPIDDLKNALTSMKAAMSDLAAAQQRLDTLTTSYASSLVSYQNRLSNLESADLTQAAIELETQQTNYEATIDIAAKIMNMEGLIAKI